MLRGGRFFVDTVYIHFRRLLPCYGILSGAKFTLRPNLAFSYIGSVTARLSSSGCQTNFAALSRGRHLYLARRPSRWALAHILVTSTFDRWHDSRSCITTFHNVSIFTMDTNVYHMQWTAEGSVFGTISLVFCLCTKYLWNRWTDFHQIHMEDSFGPSLGRVSRLRSTIRVNGQGHQGQKVAFFGPFGGVPVVYVW